MKSLVASVLAKRVKDGEVIGLGSGTTVELAIEQIGQRILREGLCLMGVPTSFRTGVVAQRAGIHVLSPLTCPKLSWAFDGADEVDPQLNLIKGRGAAMLQEKIVAKRSEKLVIIVSEDKLVDRLGTRFPVPVELVPEALPLAQDELMALGAREAVLREAVNKFGPVVSEHNNLILDVWFDSIEPELEKKIKLVTGVVDSGLFVGFSPEVLIAKESGVWSRKGVGDQQEETLIESMVK